MHYNVIPSKVWEHKQTHQRVSIYGAVPWISEHEKTQWHLITTGWTVQNPYTGEVGIGRHPWATKDAAERWAAEHMPSPTLMYD